MGGELHSRSVLKVTLMHGKSESREGKLREPAKEKNQGSILKRARIGLKRIGTMKGGLEMEWGIRKVWRANAAPLRTAIVICRVFKNH